MHRVDGHIARVFAAVIAIVGATGAQAQPAVPDSAIQAPSDLPGTMAWIEGKLIGRKTRSGPYTYVITRVKVGCHAIAISDEVSDARQYGNPSDEAWEIPVDASTPRSDVTGVGDFEFICVHADCISLTIAGVVSMLGGYDIQLNPPTLAGRLKEAVDQLKALCKSRPA